MGVESIENKLEEQEPMAPTASMETVAVVRIIKVHLPTLSVCLCGWMFGLLLSTLYINGH